MRGVLRGESLERVERGVGRGGSPYWKNKKGLNLAVISAGVLQAFRMRGLLPMENVIANSS